MPRVLLACMYNALDLLHSVTMTSGASMDVIGAFFMIVLPPRSLANFTPLFDRSGCVLKALHHSQSLI